MPTDDHEGRARKMAAALIEQMQARLDAGLAELEAAWRDVRTSL